MKSIEISLLGHRTGQRWLIAYSQQDIKFNDYLRRSPISYGMNCDNLGLLAKQVFSLSYPEHSCGLHPAPLLWSQLLSFSHAKFFKHKHPEVTSPQNFPTLEAFSAWPGIGKPLPSLLRYEDKV